MAADSGLAAIGELVLTLVVVGVVMMAIARAVPRCPECGGIQLSKILIGYPIWICERCQTVFRVR